MKKLRNIVFSFVCLLAAYSLYAANDPDLSKGLDLTSRTTVTASQLNQLVDAGTLRTNRAALLLTNAAPNVVANPRYTNWIWLDQSSIPFVLKAWNANSNAWIAVSFGTNAITTAQIGDGQVTTVKIANGAVTTDKLGDNSVTEAKIVAGQVSASKMANNAITTLSITNGAVTTEKLAVNSVNTTNVVDGSITSNKIAAATITSDKFAPGAIGAASIEDNSITGIKIVTGAIGTTNIANSAVTTNKISFGMWLSTNQTVAIPAAAATATLTHTFPAQPQSVNVVLVCTSADLGYSVGDEIHILSAINNAGADDYPMITYSVTAAGITFTRGSTSTATSNFINRKDTGVPDDIVTTSWNIKYYATYFPTPN